MLLFRENHDKVLINLQIERDVYSHQWVSIWWDGKMGRGTIRMTKKKNASQDTPKPNQNIQEERI